MLYKLPFYALHYLLVMIYDIASYAYARLTSVEPEPAARAAAAARAARLTLEQRIDRATNFTIGGPGRGIPMVMCSRIPGNMAQISDMALQMMERWEPREVYTHKSLVETELFASQKGILRDDPKVEYNYWFFIDAQGHAALPAGADPVAAVAAWALTKTSTGYHSVRGVRKWLSEVEISHFQVNPVKRHLRFGMAAVEAIHAHDAGQRRTVLECKRNVAPFYQMCGFEIAKEDMGQIPSFNGYVWLVRDREPAELA